MKAAPAPYSEQQLKQAMTWFVRLQPEECQAGDYRDFSVWLSQKPAHSVAYQEAERFWGKLDSLKTLALPELQEARNLNAATSIKKHLSNTSGILIVAVLSGAACLEYSAKTVYYTTGLHERSHGELADHSQIDLNVSTRVSAQISPFRRKIILEYGEALYWKARWN